MTGYPIAARLRAPGSHPTGTAASPACDGTTRPGLWSAASVAVTVMSASTVAVV